MDSAIKNKSDEIIRHYSELAAKSSAIDPALYTRYDVKRGLRDISGKGVLAGLTEICEVQAYTIRDSELIPCDGNLFYRGINIRDIVSGFIRENRYGFEETVYLLLFGELPDRGELDALSALLASYRRLPDGFVRDSIMSSPSKDVMNTLARSVLTLYTYDDRADDLSVENIVRQSLQLIAQFPLLAVYGYQAYAHYHHDESLFIHSPDPDVGTAENILRMLRPDCRYTPLESRILDLALVLHAEHGGGNNSSFTTHVVTSSGTDTYSVIAASLGSLKGPRHGGANIKVVRMFEDMESHLKDWTDDEAIERYLGALLHKEAFDRSGLIYGIGHAVYSLSDPRAVIFKKFVERLAEEKGLLDEYRLYAKVEELAPKVIGRERRIYKGVSANVDFYSGFVYKMLNLPMELYTPIFAVARIAGWCAHRIEEVVNSGKISRPAYTSICEPHAYLRLEDR